MSQDVAVPIGRAETPHENLQVASRFAEVARLLEAQGARHYTALFSNTAHAHQAGKTGDWVVLYCDAAAASAGTR